MTQIMYTDASGQLDSGTALDVIGDVVVVQSDTTGDVDVVDKDHTTL